LIFTEGVRGPFAQIHSTTAKAIRPVKTSQKSDPHVLTSLEWVPWFTGLGRAKNVLADDLGISDCVQTHDI